MFKDSQSARNGAKGAAVVGLACCGALILPTVFERPRATDVSVGHAAGTAYMDIANQITVPALNTQVINITKLQLNSLNNNVLPYGQITRDQKNLVIFPEQAQLVKNNLTTYAQPYLHTTLPVLRNAWYTDIAKNAALSIGICVLTEWLVSLIRPLNRRHTGYTLG